MNYDNEYINLVRTYPQVSIHFRVEYLYLSEGRLGRTMPNRHQLEHPADCEPLQPLSDCGGLAIP